MGTKAVFEHQCDRAGCDNVEWSDMRPEDMEYKVHNDDSGDPITLCSECYRKLSWWLGSGQEGRDIVDDVKILHGAI